MKTFQVSGRSASVNAGLVKMSQDQYRNRRHQVKSRGDDVYEVLLPIQFKHGEEFGFDGEFPKSMAQEVVTPDQNRADAKAKKTPKKTEQEPDDNRAK